MPKTVSIRMDEDNYAFLHKLAKEEKEDLSKAVREVVYKGRVMLAIERYKKGQASLGKAAELAGMPIGQMINPPGRVRRTKQSRGGRLCQGLGTSSKGVVAEAFER